jgi:predicted HAD superfamily Cof-like phosphohydrolase
MKDAAFHVQCFHEVTDTPVLTVPAFPSTERIELRVKLVDEEVGETLSALATRDMVEVADGIIDSIYVLIGMGLELGLPLGALWNEVQRSNMAKAVEQPDGTFKVLKRADHKVLKPEGWTPPDIAGVLRAHGWKG